MSRRIFEYFDKRHMEEVLRQPSSDDGPVITISRQTGCNARQVAESAIVQLNMKYHTDKWRWLDKDVIFDIAREIEADPHRIESFYKGIEHSNLSEMVMALSGTFVSDQRVKRAIEDVILSICKEGHIILVGRAGVSIAQGVANSLHVRLMAPFYWRVESVMRTRGIPIDEAEEFLLESDERRFKLIQTFLRQRSVNIDYLFDATLNRSHFSVSHTASLIVSLFEARIASKVSDEKNSL
jgi:cytidylate kinase